MDIGEPMIDHLLIYTPIDAKTEKEIVRIIYYYVWPELYHENSEQAHALIKKVLNQLRRRRNTSKNLFLIKKLANDYAVFNKKSRLCCFFRSCS